MSLDITPSDSLDIGGRCERYRNLLLLIARMQIGPRLRGKADPQDVVQETFLLAYSQYATFRGSTDSEFLAWLKAILASRIAKLVRRYCGTEGRDVNLEVTIHARIDQSSAEIAHTLAGADSTPSSAAMRRELELIVADALAQLPEHYREVLILRHLEGLTMPEVAQRMERTVDSVEKIWSRALPKLREIMGSWP